MAVKITLEEVLREHTKEGVLYEKLPENWVRCYACGHRCKIPEGKPGICKVRFNVDGLLYVPTGYAGGIQCDPVEKKPFFHVLPGARALSFGMLGCDFHCGYCQNWLTSQALRDPMAGTPPAEITPGEMVALARRYRAQILTSTYNEPLITSEWAVEVFQEGKKQGLLTSYVSNGNATPEVLDYIKPWVDLYKVDLKSFQDKNYRKLGGKLETVLETISLLVKKKFWLEVVTLVVPDFNDSEEELREIARFLKGVSPDIPWHVTAFHQDYKMMDRSDTPNATIMRGAEIGYEEGLRYVYAGNRPGYVGGYENTCCPSCKELLVERFGFRVVANRLRNGSCPQCQTTIPGVWSLPKS